MPELGREGGGLGLWMVGLGFEVGDGRVVVVEVWLGGYGG